MTHLLSTVDSNTHYVQDLILLRTTTNTFVTHSHKTRPKSPEHFLKYRPIYMSLFMGETLSEYDE